MLHGLRPSGACRITSLRRCWDVVRHDSAVASQVELNLRPVSVLQSRGLSGFLRHGSSKRSRHQFVQLLHLVVIRQVRPNGPSRVHRCRTRHFGKTSQTSRPRVFLLLPQSQARRSPSIVANKSPKERLDVRTVRRGRERLATRRLHRWPRPKR